jgi:hypothetical protein
MEVLQCIKKKPLVIQNSFVKKILQIISKIKKLKWKILTEIIGQ